MRVPLTQGKLAVIDDCDINLVSQHKWYAVQTGRGEKRYWYAATTINRRRVYMHRFLIAGKPKRVDDVNNDTLDNRRLNLRPCSPQQNAWNHEKSNANTSGYRGVCWDRSRRKWIASICDNGVHIHLGRFDCAIAAARAYDIKAVQLRGAFAKPNFSVAMLNLSTNS